MLGSLELYSWVHVGIFLSVTVLVGVGYYGIVCAWTAKLGRDVSGPSSGSRSEWRIRPVVEKVTAGGQWVGAP